MQMIDKILSLLGDRQDTILSFTLSRVAVIPSTFFTMINIYAYFNESWKMKVHDFIDLLLSKRTHMNYTPSDLFWWNDHDNSSFS